ncbi:MAG: dienelactone hydrolase family protein [Planctomycetes bacterium]|nr:dienelactone hydrolase family protein [Planctomycetota bacterium]
MAGVVAGWWLGLLEMPLRATVLRQQTIDVRGTPRQYRLVIPDSLDGQTPAPLMLAFPGAGDTPEDMARYTRLNRLAASKGFCLAYLEGRHLSWPPMIPVDNPEQIDLDLQFVDALCEELAAKYNVDEKRIYAVGLSQGACFVNLLVAKRSEKLAAAASHSGWLPSPLPDEGIRAARKCPVMFIVGSLDQQVSPATVQEAYTCFQREGHPVEFCLMEGLGHQWALERDANERIWAFLSRYRLP